MSKQSRRPNRRTRHQVDLIMVDEYAFSWEAAPWVTYRRTPEQIKAGQLDQDALAVLIVLPFRSLPAGSLHCLGEFAESSDTDPETTVQALEHSAATGLLRWNHFRQGIVCRMTYEESRVFLDELAKQMSPAEVSALKARQRAVFRWYHPDATSRNATDPAGKERGR